MAQLVYFDSSIFIEMAAKRSKYKKQIKALLKELNEDHARIYTSILTIQEISVAAYRPGDVARDTHGDVKGIGVRIYEVTKDVALTCAKREAELRYLAEQKEAKRDSSKPETEAEKIERICENRRRKWDCFHIATAQEIGCSELYTADEKLLNRPKHLNLKGIRAVRPGTSLRKISGPLTEAAGLIDV